MVMKYTIYVINTFSSHTSYVKVSESMQEIRSLSFTKPEADEYLRRSLSVRD